MPFSTPAEFQTWPQKSIPVSDLCFSAIKLRIIQLECPILDKLLNRQGPLDKQQRREAGSFKDVDQDQHYFLIKRKTKCKADRTAQRVILMPNISVSHY